MAYMKDIGDLIQAPAGLLWFGLAVYLVREFGPGIKRILLSARKGRLFGQEFEIVRVRAFPTDL
jgi:hypothetical protein